MKELIPKFSCADRIEALREAARQPFDIAIVGAGINGCAAARDAAMRGLRTLLIDKADIAAGTSSKSSKLIHGGLRYIEHLHLRLVREAVAERWKLMHLAPHLVRPMPFLFPGYKGVGFPPSIVRLGVSVYGMLSLGKLPGKSKLLSRKQVLALAPQLREKELRGGVKYYDCATDDSRLTLENCLDAVANGATVLPYVELHSVDEKPEGTLSLFVKDNLLGEAIEMTAKLLLVTVGPWTDELLHRIRPQTPKWLAPSRGIHISVDAGLLRLNQTVVMQAPQDGRITFAIPWGNRVYVGTTDVYVQSPQQGQIPSREEVDYLLETVRFYFPEADITRASIRGIWASTRPLVRAGSEHTNPSDVSREEKIKSYDEKFVVLAGGKLTTHRILAAKAVDEVAHILAKKFNTSVPRSRTHRQPLAGAKGISTMDLLLADLQNEFPHLPNEWLHHLVHTYGMRAAIIAKLSQQNPDLLEPLIDGQQWRIAEAVYSINYEHASTIEDFLERRTQILYRNIANAVECARRLQPIFQRELGYSTNQLDEQLNKLEDKIKTLRQAFE